MPLVPLATVSRWYRTDSWVYRAFAYTYQNRAWNVPIPQGYSLCPYFWRATLGGLFLCRIAVWITLAAKPIGRLLGRHMLTITACVFCGFMGLLLLCATLSAWYNHYRSAYLLVAVPLVSCLSSAIYMGNHKNDPNRCRVERYIVLSFVADIVMAIGRFPVIRHVWPHSIGHFLWLCLAWVGHALAWCGLKVVAFFAWSFAGSGLVIVLPLLVLLVTGVVIDWLLNRPLPPLAAAPADDLSDWKTARNRFAKWAERSWMEGDFSTWPDNRWTRFIDRFIFGDSALQLELCNPNLTGDQYTDIMRRLMQRYNAAQAISDARWAKLDLICVRFTEVARFILLPLIWVWRMIRWIGVQSWTFACLLWSLWKARKQGFCPYLPFTTDEKS